MNSNAAESVRNACRHGEISETVVITVAEATGVDPLELEPLYEVVDPDALNRLFRSAPGFVEVSFRMANCEVVVHCDGEVVVTPSVSQDHQVKTPQLAD